MHFGGIFPNEVKKKFSPLSCNEAGSAMPVGERIFHQGGERA